MEKVCKFCGQSFKAIRNFEYACKREECQKARKKEYRKNLLAKDPDYRKKEGKRYYEKHKAEILKRTKAYRETHHEEYLASLKEYREQNKQELLDLFSSKCEFCEGELSIKDNCQFHKKDGKTHEPFNSDSRKVKYMKEHKEEFALLHLDCHKAVHALMERLGYNWERIKNLKNKP